MLSLKILARKALVARIVCVHPPATQAAEVHHVGFISSGLMREAQEGFCNLRPPVRQLSSARSPCNEETAYSGTTLTGCRTSPDEFPSAQLSAPPSWGMHIYIYMYKYRYTHTYIVHMYIQTHTDIYIYIYGCTRRPPPLRVGCVRAGAVAGMWAEEHDDGHEDHVDEDDQPSSSS